MARRALVDRYPMTGPDDVSAIAAAMAQGRLDPERIVAILGKTEGNGCVNDFSRGLAVHALRGLLATSLTPQAFDLLPMVMSGGTEGGLSPHWIVLHTADGAGDGPALAFASSVTPALHPSDIGRTAQVHLVRDAVVAAMQDAGITSPQDVHYVQVKCPLLTAQRVAQAGGDVATTDMLKSMGLSRGAAALGVALALGEIAAVADDAICADRSLWSARASCSAGIELTTCEVVVMGQSADWGGPLRIDHAVMADAIDAAAVTDLLARAGLTAGSARLHALLAKAEAALSGQIRGARHTMLDDSDISSTRHARGFVGGLLAGLAGTTQIFVSGGAEHQGPDGGGPVAIIFETQQEGQR